MQARSASDVYAAALSQQQNLMNQSVAGYNRVLQQLRADQSATIAGYNQLSNTVVGELTNLGRTAAADLSAQYTALSGQAAQDLTSRGLGNTTVASSVQRGLAFDKARADVALSESVGRQRADYLSQIGLAGLDYRGRAAAQYAGLGAQGAGVYAQFAPAYAGIYRDMARYQAEQDVNPFEFSLRVQQLYGGLGASNAALSSQNRRSAGAESLSGRQLGFNYSRVGQEAGMARQANLQQLANQTRTRLGAAATAANQGRTYTAARR